MNKNSGVRSFFLAVGVASVALLSAACGPKAGPVVLSPTWPQQVDKYDVVNAKWTRVGEVYQGVERVLHAVAIFKSPEWRTAMIDRRARLERLSTADRSSLLAQEKQQADKFYEVTVLVTTYNRRENDLHKGPRSVWKLALMDDQGNRVVSTEAKRDRRPLDVIRSEYPQYGDFAQAYLVRFPKTIDILRTAARYFSLRIAGTRGATELFWRVGRGRI